jgi:hypothetical protein
MKRAMIGGIAALVLGLTAAPLKAQTAVEGAAAYREGGREVIVVQRIRVPHRNAYHWWKRHGYRKVTVYYDGNRYYIRRVARPGLRALVVYELKGRYYLGDARGDRDSRGDQEDDEHHD